MSVHGHALVGGGGSRVQIPSGRRGVARDVRVTDGLRQPESLVGPRHGIGHRADVGGIIIRIERFNGGGFVAQDIPARDAQGARQAVRQIVAAGIPQEMKIAPASGETEAVAAGIAVGSRNRHRGRAMQRLLQVADEVEQLPQVERAIALSGRRVLQHGDVGADCLHDIERAGHETIGWRAIEAEGDVDEMPVVPGVRRTLEIISPNGSGHESVVDAAGVNDWRGDERIALGLHRRREMVVGDLRADHVALGIPCA